MVRIFGKKGGNDDGDEEVEYYQPETGETVGGSKLDRATAHEAAVHSARAARGSVARRVRRASVDVTKAVMDGIRSLRGPTSGTSKSSMVYGEDRSTHGSRNGEECPIRGGSQRRPTDAEDTSIRGGLQHWESTADEEKERQSRGGPAGSSDVDGRSNCGWGYPDSSTHGARRGNAMLGSASKSAAGPGSGTGPGSKGHYLAAAQAPGALRQHPSKEQQQHMLSSTSTQRQQFAGCTAAEFEQVLGSTHTDVIEPTSLLVSHELQQLLACDVGRGRAALTSLIDVRGSHDAHAARTQSSIYSGSSRPVSAAGRAVVLQGPGIQGTDTNSNSNPAYAAGGSAKPPSVGGLLRAPLQTSRPGSNPGKGVASPTHSSHSQQGSFSGMVGVLLGSPGTAPVIGGPPSPTSRMVKPPLLLLRESPRGSPVASGLAAGAGGLARQESNTSAGTACSSRAGTAKAIPEDPPTFLQRHSSAASAHSTKRTTVSNLGGSSLTRSSILSQLGALFGGPQNSGSNSQPSNFTRDAAYQQVDLGKISATSSALLSARRSHQALDRGSVHAHMQSLAVRAVSALAAMQGAGSARAAALSALAGETILPRQPAAAAAAAGATAVQGAGAGTAQDASLHADGQGQVAATRAKLKSAVSRLKMVLRFRTAQQVHEAVHAGAADASQPDTLHDEHEHDGHMTTLNELLSLVDQSPTKRPRGTRRNRRASQGPITYANKLHGHPTSGNVTATSGPGLGARQAAAMRGRRSFDGASEMLGVLGDDGGDVPARGRHGFAGDSSDEEHAMQPISPVLQPDFAACRIAVPPLPRTSLEYLTDPRADSWSAQSSPTHSAPQAPWLTNAHRHHVPSMGTSGTNISGYQRSLASAASLHAPVSSSHGGRQMQHGLATAHASLAGWMHGSMRSNSLACKDSVGLLPHVRKSSGVKEAASTDGSPIHASSQAPLFSHALTMEQDTGPLEDATTSGTVLMQGPSGLDDVTLPATQDGPYRPSMDYIVDTSVPMTSDADIESIMAKLGVSSAQHRRSGVGRTNSPSALARPQHSGGNWECEGHGRYNKPSFSMAISSPHAGGDELHVNVNVTPNANSSADSDSQLKQQGSGRSTAWHTPAMPSIPLVMSGAAAARAAAAGSGASVAAAAAASVVGSAAAGQAAAGSPVIPSGDVIPSGGVGEVGVGPWQHRQPACDALMQLPSTANAVRTVSPLARATRREGEGAAPAVTPHACPQPHAHPILERMESLSAEDVPRLAKRNAQVASITHDTVSAAHARALSPSIEHAGQEPAAPASSSTLALLVSKLSALPEHLKAQIAEQLLSPRSQGSPLGSQGPGLPSSLTGQLRVVHHGKAGSFAVSAASVGTDTQGTRISGKDSSLKTTASNAVLLPTASSSICSPGRLSQPALPAGGSSSGSAGGAGQGKAVQVFGAVQPQRLGAQGIAFATFPGVPCAPGPPASHASIGRTQLPAEGVDSSTAGTVNGASIASVLIHNMQAPAEAAGVQAKTSNTDAAAERPAPQLRCKNGKEEEKQQQPPATEMRQQQQQQQPSPHSSKKVSAQDVALPRIVVPYIPQGSPAALAAAISSKTPRQQVVMAAAAHGAACILEIPVPDLHAADPLASVRQSMASLSARSSPQAFDQSNPVTAHPVGLACEQSLPQRGVAVGSLSQQLAAASSPSLGSSSAHQAGASGSGAASQRPQSSSSAGLVAAAMPRLSPDIIVQTAAALAGAGVAAAASPGQRSLSPLSKRAAAAGMAAEGLTGAMLGSANAHMYDMGHMPR